MFCHKCKSEIDLPNKKVGFRDACNICEADLHCCANCKYYIIGKPNDCFVPNTDFINDREKNNFCEEFTPLEKLKNDIQVKKEDVEKKLFKSSEDDNFPTSFDSLFKD
jgi:hypothetical protein